MKKFIYIFPYICSDTAFEFHDCAGQIRSLVSSAIINGCCPVKINVFLKIHLQEYILKVRQFEECLRQAGLQDIPVSFIPQAPVFGNVMIEAVIEDKMQELKKLEFRKYDNTGYLKLDYEDRTEIISSGIFPENPHAEFIFKVDYCLRTAGEILTIEGMSFADIVRQWNYIGNICECILKDKCINQNYQIFNDIRTKYYDTASWVNGYPASTGIGTGINTCLIDFIAVKPRQDAVVIPLKNPRQADAHKYTSEVLKGDALKGHDIVTPPKFERGKIVGSQFGAEVYVSGTAAILGQDSVECGDAAAQAKITAENILELVSRENIHAHGYNSRGRRREFENIRVYLKNPGDYDIVKAVCDANFPGIPSAYVLADVCRFELLVEIEAYLSIVNK